MRVPLLSIAACAILCAAQNPFSSKKTYFVDSNCDYKTSSLDLVDIPAESIAIASAAAWCLDNDKDQDCRNAYSHTLKVTDKEKKKQARRILKDIADNWTRALIKPGEREKAALRIHCDNDVRWTRIPNPLDPGEPAQQSRHVPDGPLMWSDKLDSMWARKTCQTDPLYAHVFQEPFFDKAQNPKRRAITLCDDAWSVPDLAGEGIPLLIEKLLEQNRDLGLIAPILRAGMQGKEQDLPVAQIDAFRYFPSVILLREWLKTYSLDEKKPTTQLNVYGNRWETLTALEMGVAVVNVDSYVYFGVLALLSKKGWALPHVGNMASQADKSNAELAAKGQLVYYRK